MNVDFYAEEGRTAVITDWAVWWDGIQQIVSPVRRDFYTWLAFSGCRAGETMSMAIADIDLDKGVVRYPVTRRVNNARNEGPDLVVPLGPLGPEPGGHQLTFG